MRATITHPGGAQTPQEAGHNNVGALEFPETVDYTAVSSGAATMATKFPDLAVLNWTLSAGKLHPASVTTSRRYPSSQELQVWNTVNADQAVPSIDSLTINGPVTPPVWFSEKTIRTRDVAVALQLARRHLPVMATLPSPVLHTASDQISGHIGGLGTPRGPVSVTVGGCTRHDPRVYLPMPAEQGLIDTYETCRR
jgi:hypothetical protein